MTRLNHQTNPLAIHRILVALGVTSAMACLCALLPSCGAPEPVQSEPIAPPERTATQDEAIRSLLVNAGEAHLCGVLRGKLMGLPGGDAPSGARAGLAPAEGRLWVEECQTSRSDSRLKIHLEGRGWTWADERRQGPLGSVFKVKGYLRFNVTADVSGVLDMGYTERHQVLSVWFTPRGSTAAKMRLLGELPVTPQGGWSGIIGAFGEALAGPLERQARPIVAQHGGAMIASRLGRGITATNDLCTGQLDTLIGTLGDGETPQRPFTSKGLRWLENQRVRIRPGGIDVAGPWDTAGDELRVDVEAEAGDGFEARLVCQDVGHRVLEAFIQGRPAPPIESLARQTIGRGRSATLELESTQCPVMMITTPVSREQDRVELRYRAYSPEHRAEELVRCGERDRSKRSLRR